MTSKKQLISRKLKCGKDRIWVDPARYDEVKDAITTNDILNLVKQKIVKKKPKTGVSKVRARKIRAQKTKGRRKGRGSRKGKKTVLLPGKTKWMIQVRALRKYLRELKKDEKITQEVYRQMYRKVSGGFFRNKAHLKMYLNQNGYLTEGDKK